MVFTLIYVFPRASKALQDHMGQAFGRDSIRVHWKLLHKYGAPTWLSDTLDVQWGFLGGWPVGKSFWTPLPPPHTHTKLSFTPLGSTPLDSFSLLWVESWNLGKLSTWLSLLNVATLEQLGLNSLFSPLWEQTDSLGWPQTIGLPAHCSQLVAAQMLFSFSWLPL